MSPSGAATRPPGVFFVHVMKTGGLSFNEAMRSHYPLESVYPRPAYGERVAWKVSPRALLAADPARLSKASYFTVHMPAWIAEAVAPDFLRVTVLRDPVERTISHLRHIARRHAAYHCIEDIYDDETWADRLANYQTRLFAESRSDHDQRLRPVDRGQLRHYWFTAIGHHPGRLGESDLDSALDRLRAFDVVGTTDQLADVVRRVLCRIGAQPQPAPHVNAAADGLRGSASLRRRIAEDNELDIQLVEEARRLSSVQG
jgi:hypothetical protein